MQNHSITVQKSARVFSLGNLDTAKEIWIVLHGYAQLASDFIKTFEPIMNDNRAIIAPEGLHRFYRKGFYGDVVASWMTKEDRLNDIEDYTTYLNQVVEQFSTGDQTIHVLGFSQGVATACRWIAKSNVHVGSMVLWAGTFPTDITLEHPQSNLASCKSYLVYDNEDPFRNEDSWQKQLNFFKKIGLSTVVHTYTGGHKIPSEELIQFFKENFD